MASVSDYLYSKASAKKIPLGGSFELSPVCNFSCKMCYVRKTQEQIRLEGKQIKDWKEWLSLAEQCKEAGMLYLLLTGGEPFLYPNFRELYEHLHKMGFVLSINSNGTLIDEETVQWLKNYAPSRVNITLYGASEETYQRICGNSAGYDKAVRAIDLLCSAGIPVVINASMIPENECDLEKIIRFGQERQLNTRVATYMFPPARREGEQTDSRFNPEQSAKVFLRKVKCLHGAESYANWLRGECAKLGSVREETDDWGEHREEYMRCRAGRSSFWISWEGIMTACGIVPFPMTCDPFREGFLSCWLRLTDMVRTTPVLGGCKDCAHKELCKPCVAMIQAETGGVNEKAPYLCEMVQSLETQMITELEEAQRE